MSKTQTKKLFKEQIQRLLLLYQDGKLNPTDKHLVDLIRDSALRRLNKSPVKTLTHNAIVNTMAEIAHTDCDIECFEVPDIKLRYEHSNSDTVIGFLEHAIEEGSCVSEFASKETKAEIEVIVHDMQRILENARTPKQIHPAPLKRLCSFPTPGLEHQMTTCVFDEHLSMSDSLTNPGLSRCSEVRSCYIRSKNGCKFYKESK